MKISILTFWLFFSLGLWAQSIQNNNTLTENEKIEFLLSKVESLTQAKFIRNGVSYDSQAAAAHLRMKWEKTASKIKTVNDFIDKVASNSSASGEPYYIEYSNGEKIAARQFYLNCLKELDAKANSK